MQMKHTVCWPLSSGYKLWSKSWDLLSSGVMENCSHSEVCPQTVLAETSEKHWGSCRELHLWIERLDKSFQASTGQPMPCWSSADLPKREIIVSFMTVCILRKKRMWDRGQTHKICGRELLLSYTWQRSRDRGLKTWDRSWVVHITCRLV